MSDLINEISQTGASAGINPRAKWYVVHTYTGYENIVKDSIEKQIVKNSLQDVVLEIKIPVEDYIEESPSGKRKVMQRKVFPCYVFIKMEFSNDLWHMITHTRGVTSFLGPGGHALPLREEEIRRMRLENVVVEVNFKVGDKVKIISGPLESSIGDVEAIDMVNQKCNVIVSMFGRQTPVELDFVQVEKI